MSPDRAGSRRHLGQGVQSSLLSAGAAAVGSGIRVPFTISTVGVAGYGVISTIVGLFGWVGFIYAGARVSGGALASRQQGILGPRIAAVVGRATVKTAAPVLVLLLAVTLVIPVRSVIDPSATMAAFAVQSLLLVALVLGLICVPGSALLGAETTRGDFRLQNLSIVVGTGMALFMTVVAWHLSWSVEAFTAIWLCAAAVPALPAAIWLVRRRSACGADNEEDPEAQSVSSSAMWISGGQLLASGFDLVIITSLLGSSAAAEFALVARLIALTTTPVIGAVPVLMRSAGLARSSRSNESRATLRKVAGATFALQLLGILGFIAAAPWICGVLSGGRIRPQLELIVAAALWIVIETGRRVLMAMTSTTSGLRVWRSASLLASVPNLVLSIVLAQTMGIAGPLLSTVFVGCLTTLVVAWVVRDTLREAI